MNNPAAILKTHTPMPWWRECDEHPRPPRGDPAEHAWDDEHFLVGEEGMWTCGKNRAQDRCAVCTPDDADDFAVDSVPWPCQPARDAAVALGVDLEG